MTTKSLINVFILLFLILEPASTMIYTLSLHDALPISDGQHRLAHGPRLRGEAGALLTEDQHTGARQRIGQEGRSEEHTSELQSRGQLVCRHLLEKKKKKIKDKKLWSFLG